MPEQVSGYIATFHTHLSALLTCQSLTACGAAARMMPVPRKLSASCGTCVSYQADSPLLEQMDPTVGQEDTAYDKRESTAVQPTECAL